MIVIEDIYKIAARGNGQALEFLFALDSFWLEARTFIFEDDKHPGRFMGMLMFGSALWSHPFHQLNSERLYGLVRLLVADLHASLVLPDASEQIKQWDIVFVKRFNDLLLIVADICGGVENMRQVAMLLSK